MKFLILIVICVVLAIVFFSIGKVIGNSVGKIRKKQQEIAEKGSKHV